MRWLPIELASALTVETIAVIWRLTPHIVRDTIMDGIYAAEET